jgi:hypothetical protein
MAIDILVQIYALKGLGGQCPPARFQALSIQ